MRQHFIDTEKIILDERERAVAALLIKDQERQKIIDYIAEIDITLKLLREHVGRGQPLATPTLHLSKRYLDFRQLDIDMSKIRKPNTDSEAVKLIAYILAVERELSVARDRRGLSPSEISMEIARLFGRKVDRVKINGRLHYLSTIGKMDKNGKHYFLPAAA